MREFVDKLKQARDEMLSEKGAIALFALFKREDWPEQWDLVVAAGWTTEGLRKSIDYIFEKLSYRLTQREFLMIARVVPLLPSVPFVRAVHEMVGEVDKPKEIPGFTFEGMELKRGYILASHPESHSEARALEAVVS
jgi:hypothetical protein